MFVFWFKELGRAIESESMPDGAQPEDQIISSVGGSIFFWTNTKKYNSKYLFRNLEFTIHCEQYIYIVL